MHTPESLSALTAREFLNLMRGYEPAEIDSLMSWLWGKPEVLAAGLNYLDRCREFAAITDSERTCDEVNPDGHWPCHRSGKHDEHRDHNGGTWGGPAHHATPAGEAPCEAEDRGYTCTAQAGHAGPEHVAYGVDSRVCHRWPVGTLHPHCEHCDPDSCNPMTPGHVVACRTPGCPSVQQLASVAS